MAIRVYFVNPFRTIVQVFLAIALIALLGRWIFNGFEWRSEWDQVQQQQRLIVAVRESEGVYWPVGQDISGFEYDILAELETRLGVAIQPFAVRNLDDLYRALEVGAVQMALTGTTLHSAYWLQSHPYYVTQLGMVVKPKSEASNETVRIGLLDQQAATTVQPYLNEQLPNHELNYEAGRSSAELLTLLELEELDAVILDLRDFQLQQTVFPGLRFEPLNDQDNVISMIFNPNHDGTILSRVNEAILDIDNSGLLVQMIDRHFGHASDFDFVDNLTFERHISARLPTFEPLFREQQALTGIDWRLLAAVAYQESHLRPNAVSPTGVRGIMMVTLDTARDMGISNRLDPAQSIDAGSRYLASLMTRVPSGIEEPDRTWFALAAYNVGLGHLGDARRITEIEGGDPNRWIDVRRSLPKLALKSYYPWTRYGYARGNEPVVYVANIRQYYDKLKRLYPEEGDTIEPDRLEQLPTAPVPIFPNL